MFRKNIATPFCLVALLVTSTFSHAALIEESFDNNQYTTEQLVQTGGGYFQNEQFVPTGRDYYRTADEFFPTEENPFSFNFTMTFLGGNMGFIGLRTSDNPYDPNREPADGVNLRIHNFQGGHTGMGENFGQNYQYFNPASGDRFYAYGNPIRTEIMDFGSYISVSMQNTVTNELNEFIYNSDFSAGGYYGIASSGGIHFDDITMSINSESVAVSEPGMLGLLGAGLIALGYSARRRRSSK